MHNRMDANLSGAVFCRVSEQLEVASQLFDRPLDVHAAGVDRSQRAALRVLRYRGQHVIVCDDSVYMKPFDVSRLLHDALRHRLWESRAFVRKPLAS
eukprot:TRINITY_DN2187_c0_g1_i2.p1 TRINITY_DN2187_c0_g1~~TRINITY_DN2187_c0_g1_i2.p1  ORF type:complete len:114 (-),score=3.37 TRINITY_DN2187_c0_g1_i2:108-398(-)